MEPLELKKIIGKINAKKLHPLAPASEMEFFDVSVICFRKKKAPSLNLAVAGWSFLTHNVRSTTLWTVAFSYIV